METEQPTDLSKPTKTLDDARREVLQIIPGIDQNLTPQEIDSRLDSQIQDIIKQFDAENMVVTITRDMGLSQKEANIFFLSPERKPFQSSVKFAQDHQEKQQQYLVIGTYLSCRYEEAKHMNGADEIKNAKEILKNFLDYSSFTLFSPSYFEYEDRFNGIDSIGRLEGEARTTKEMSELIRKSVQHVALETSINPEQLMKDVLDVTEGGKFSLINTYLYYKGGSSAVRSVLEAIRVARVTDVEYTKQLLTLLSNSHAYQMAMGIDLTKYYELSNFPDPDIVADRLKQFLVNPDIVTEFIDLIHQEAPTIKIDSSTPITLYKLLAFRANHLKLSDKVSTLQELEALQKDAWKSVGEILSGLVFVKSPYTEISAPTSLLASTRPSSISYYNINGDIVYVAMVNLRRGEKEVWKQAGHEFEAHMLHVQILQLARKYGYQTKDYGKIPQDIQETLAELIWDQMSAIYDAKRSQQSDIPSSTTEPTKKTREFNDLLTAIITREDVLYALTQTTVRLEIEDMMKRAKGNSLNNNEISELSQYIKTNLIQWNMLGISMISPSYTPISLINGLLPNDGLMYVKKYFRETLVTNANETQSDNNQPVDLQAIFEKKFNNPLWLLDRNARAVFLVLLAYTGISDDITTYGKFIAEQNPEDCIKLLQSWGITEDLI